MSVDREQVIDAMISEREIRQLSQICSHHVDRGNVEGIRSVFHPDAIAEYGFNKTKTVDEFLEHFAVQRQQLTGVQHLMTTYVIEIDGDYAEAENYVIAHNDMIQEGSPVTFVIGGRYLDKYERRDGKWKISHRIGIEDWSLKVPTPPTRGTGLVGDIPIGAIGEDDPTYGFFRLID